MRSSPGRYLRHTCREQPSSSSMACLTHTLLLLVAIHVLAWQIPEANGFLPFRPPRLLSHQTSSCSLVEPPSRILSAAAGGGDGGIKETAGTGTDSTNTTFPLTLESLAHCLRDDKFQNVLVVVGAGASVSAGIPDFRTPGTGLYDALSRFNLPFPEAVFDLQYYKTNPLPFVELCASLWPGQEGGPRPTPAHSFLKLLEKKHALLRVYTQNIDGLEALAGVEVNKLVECHGHFRSASCTSCRAEANVDECLNSMVNLKQVPTCAHCGGIVKPDVVFFGEELPVRFQDLISKDVEACDLLIVIGTSLLVMPVAGIPQWVSKTCPRLLLNRELVGDFISTMRSGGGRRDVFEKGDCDDGVKRLCQLAGWEQELNELYSSVSTS